MKRYQPCSLEYKEKENQQKIQLFSASCRVTEMLFESHVENGNQNNNKEKNICKSTVLLGVRAAKRACAYIFFVCWLLKFWCFARNL